MDAAEGAIVSPLANGADDVLAIAIDASGNMSFDTTTSELVIDTVSPISSIVAVSPSLRVTPVASIAIQFSEPVIGFSLADLQLTNGVSVPLNGATLTTTDQRNWILGNLTAITTPLGTYQFTLTATGSGITDLAGNPLLAGGSTTGATCRPYPATSISTGWWIIWIGPSGLQTPGPVRPGKEMPTVTALWTAWIGTS